MVELWWTLREYVFRVAWRICVAADVQLPRRVRVLSVCVALTTHEFPAHKCWTTEVSCWGKEKCDWVHTHTHTHTLTHRHSSQPIPCNNPGVERLPPLREERSCPFWWNYQTVDWQQKSTLLHKLFRWPVTSTAVQDLLCSVTNSNTTLTPSLPPAYPYYLSISRWAYQCLMSLQFTLNGNARNKFLVISLYLILFKFIVALHLLMPSVWSYNVNV